MGEATQAARCGVKSRREMLTYIQVRSASASAFALPRIHLSHFEAIVRWYL